MRADWTGDRRHRQWRGNGDRNPSCEDDGPGAWPLPRMRMQDASPSDQDTETQAFQRRRYIGHVERRIRGQQVPGVRQTLQTEHSIQSGGLQVHQTLLQLCRPYDSRMQDYNNRCGEGACYKQESCQADGQGPS